MIKYRFLFVFVLFGFVLAEENLNIHDFQVSSERYLTDDQGNIMMFINVWGHVPNPGHVKVYEGVDFATLISLVGGPKSGADLKNVKLFREVADNNKIVYNINFKNFIENGDRTDFIQLKPNDTIIITQKLGSYFLSQVGTFNTLLSLINLYFVVTNNYAN